MKVTQKIVVKIILVDSKTNKVFFLRRGKSHPLYSNQLDLPGGVVEDEESPIEAIKRELQEETGISLKYNPLLLRDFKIKTTSEEITFFLFYSIIDSLEDINVKLSDEHKSFLFLSRKEILDHDTSKLTDNYIISAINILKKSPVINK